MSKSRNDGSGIPPGSLTDWMKQLTPKRQELIRPVIENPREFILLSLRAAAQKLSTDSTMVVRIVQRMGFENYRAFQNYLRDLSIANATSLDGMQEGFNPQSGTSEYLNAMVQQDIRNLNAVRTKLDEKRLAALAKRLHGAHRRLLLGGDLASIFVRYLEYQLTGIGLPSFAASTVGESLHHARLMGKKDVVIAISFRKGLRQTVEAMQRARKNGAYCIGITGTYLSPIARLSDEFFVVPVESNSFIDSYVAPMALANLILVACANHNREASLTYLREVAKEQQTGFRWFGNE